MISPTVARLFLGASLLPFLWFALRDQILHFVARKVSIVENGLHLLLAFLLTIVIGQAMLFQTRWVAVALLMFVVCGAADEYIFHRGIPETEHNIHAKEHFALLLFVSVFAAIMWIR